MVNQLRVYFNVSYKLSPRPSNPARSSICSSSLSSHIPFLLLYCTPSSSSFTVFPPYFSPNLSSSSSSFKSHTIFGLSFLWPVPREGPNIPQSAKWVHCYIITPLLLWVKGKDSSLTLSPLSLYRSLRLQTLYRYCIRTRMRFTGRRAIFL